jgi:serine/threonine-protein kinase
MSDRAARWRRVDALCQAALERPEAEREAFLSESPEDDDVRREVAALLAEASKAECFLESPVGAAAASALADARDSLEGTRVGLYEVGAFLGSGGMGDVYRARDTRLNREVALKILPLTFALNPERLDRFRQEAQALASLNHLNVGGIYGFEEASGVYALVLELVDGPTLADVLERGPIPVAEALAIASQMTQALECAHEHGIVHNDFKPSNVKLRADGTVKVLDFGLATAGRATVGGQPRAAAAGARNAIFGTRAYASPEQSQGTADKRTDIWAFGVVLYEMLAGQRAFAGESDAEVNWDALPASTPEPVLRLLRRCVERDVKRRLRDIGEARIVLDDRTMLESTATASSPGARGSTSRNPSRTWQLAVGAAALAGAVIIAILLSRRPAQDVVRLSLMIPPEQSLSTGDRSIAAISPDGTRIAYVAAPAGLYVRVLSASESAPVAGVEGIGNIGEPVFSPDGQSILFHSSGDQTLKRVSISGDAPVTLCPAAFPNGVSWSTDGIVFVEPGRGILRLSPQGGAPRMVLALRPEQTAQSPQLLPGGGKLLYTLTSGNGPDRWDRARVVVRSLASGDETTVIDGGSDAQYIPTGHLVYAVGGNLFAVPFDLGGMRVTGTPAPVVQGVRRGAAATTGTAQFAIAGNGTLVYVPGPPSANWDLGIADRKGAIDRLPLPSGSYEAPRASPDGRRIAFGTDNGKEAAIWIYDVAGTASPRRLTFGGNARFPVWSRDGNRVAYQSGRDAEAAIFWQSVDGGRAERLTAPGANETQEPEAWSPTSDILVFSSKRGDRITLWSLSVSQRKASPLGDVESSSRTGAVFSPDGRWLAYASSSTSGKTIYVEPFPPTGVKYQLTVPGSRQPNHPLWSADGKELLYNPGPGQFEAVRVTTAPFGFGTPASLPRFFPGAGIQARRPFDGLPDGRFVSPITASGTTVTAGAGHEIRVVLNWFDALTARREH